MLDWAAWSTSTRIRRSHSPDDVIGTQRAYSPVLRKADLPADTTVPWWGNRRLHFELS